MRLRRTERTSLQMVAGLGVPLQERMLEHQGDFVCLLGGEYQRTKLSSAGGSLWLSRPGATALVRGTWEGPRR